MNYEIKISSRAKRLSLRVINGEVVVTVPKRHSKRVVQQFVFEHQDWINKQRQENQKLLKLKEKIRYEDGGKIRYLGEWITLALGDVREPSLNESTLTLSEKFDVKRQLQGWLIKEAQRVLAEKAAHYANVLGVNVKQVKLGKYKSKWGSAHVCGTIKFSWPIIQAPEKIVDYLVIHELAHLIEMNHSPKFWSIVEALCPTYKQRKKWLKEQGQKLSLL